jgi:hypothetical protein
MKKLKDYSELFLLFVRNLTFVYFFLLILEYFKIFYYSLYINPTTFFILVLGLGTIALLVYIGVLNIEKQKTFKEISKWLFLGLLIIIFLSTLDHNVFNKYLGFIGNYFFIVSMILGSIGIITFFLNKDLFQKIEKEEDKKEQKRSKEFGKKFPGINKIPILRTIAKWMYKEGWYSIIFILIFISAIFVLGYGIGDYEFREDEYQVIGAAAGYHFTGEYYVWDWLNWEQGERYYDRAWPHTWMIAQSYNIFGISEWSSRIVSVLFGLLLIASSYFIVKFFTQSKNIALLTTLSFTFYPLYINFFRYTRMYAVLAPIFLILFYFLYRGITEKNNINFKSERINNFIRKNLNFNYIYLILAFILLYFNYLIHINSLIILPIFFLFILYLSITKRERKYIIASITGTIGIITIILIYYFGLTTRFLHHLTFFGRRSVIYLDLLTRYPFFKEFGILFLLSGIALVFFNKKDIKDKTILSYITIGFGLLFFIFIADRYSGFLYVSHISVIFIMLIITSYYYFIKLFHSKIIRIIFIFLLLFFIGYSFIQGFDRIYRDDHSYGQFSKAYQVILDNYNPEKEVIFGQYLRTYYLKDFEGDANYISMLSNNRYEFDVFMEDLQKYESGWITWESRKSYHLLNSIKHYCCDNFVQLHGRWCKDNVIDDIGVEVFYFNKSMIN